jgi:hypothetical protein
MKTLDRIFGSLLFVTFAGHTTGTILWVPFMSSLFIWSLGASLAAAILGALNLIRVNRPNDRPIAVITAIGSFCWALLSFAFGISIHNLLDPRALINIIVGLALAGFSVHTLRGAGPKTSGQLVLRNEGPFIPRTE